MAKMKIYILKQIECNQVRTEKLKRVGGELRKYAVFVKLLTKYPKRGKAMDRPPLVSVPTVL